MIKICTLLITVGLCFTLNAEAQKTNKFGDDVTTLKGIMKAFYAVTCVRKGEQSSYERDSLLHLLGALVGLSEKDKNGKVFIRTMTLKHFHESENAGMAKTGYYERQIASKVEKFGNLYHVWSTYETRYAANGSIKGRGIDSIQLYYDGKRFWILSWFDAIESQDNPLPKDYLPK